MKFKLTKFERKDSALENIGTVVSLAGKGGKIGFIRKNLAQAGTAYVAEDGTTKIKLLALIVKNKAGDSSVLACSKQVTQAFLAKKLTLAQISQLDVLENEDGAAYVSMPAAGAVQEFSVEELTKHATPAEEITGEFVPEDSVW